MNTPTHLLFGYGLANHLSRKTKIISTKLFITTTSIFSLAPDFDFCLNPSISHHRQSPFHLPITWIATSITLFIIGHFLKRKSLKTIALAISLGALSHLFLDTFSLSAGIQWLFPFSLKKFNFWPLIPPYPNHEILYHYLHSPLPFIEAPLFIFLFFNFLKHRFNQSF